MTKKAFLTSFTVVTGVCFSKNASGNQPSPASVAKISSDGPAKNSPANSKQKSAILTQIVGGFSYVMDLFLFWI